MGPLSVSYCISKLEMPSTEKFRHSQISPFLHSIWNNKPDPPRITSYERWCSEIWDQRGGISIYSSPVDVGDKPAYTWSWELDLEEEWELDTWHQCFQRSFKGVINVSLIEAMWKLSHTGTLCPRLSKMFPDTSLLCFRGCGHLGTIFHTWWSCLRIRGFWNKKSLKCLIPQTAENTLLNTFNPLLSIFF